MAVSVEKIEAAALRIAKHCHRTPVLRSQSIDGLLNGVHNSTGGRCYRLHFKCENLQKTGSFKARGAVNAVSSLIERSQVNGNHGISVITHSSGNHGAALAFAAKSFGIPCTVVAPNNAPKAKIDAIKSYGAKVVPCGNSSADRESTCEKLMSETGAHLIHPHNMYDVMCGQGTVAKELLEQVPNLHAILVPVGGAGLVSGIATYVKNVKPDCKVICVEPMGKQLQAALSSNQRLWPHTPDTINTLADGMRVGHIGDKGFAVLQDVVDSRNVVVEPSGATCLAATFKPEFHSLLDKSDTGEEVISNVGVVVCGGNVDFDLLTSLLVE